MLKFTPVAVTAGGNDEAQAAYEEAVQAIFQLQLERYCHTQAHHNPDKEGQMRWECIEMWPIQARPVLTDWTLSAPCGVSYAQSMPGLGSLK